MKKHVVYIVVSALMVLSANSIAQTTLTLNQLIEKELTAKCLDRNQTAVSIVEVPSGRTIYQKNPAQPLLPASIMKIVTTATALHYLSPEYRFRTNVLYNGSLIAGTLQGDLIIQGRGDPKLTPEKLWHIAHQLKNAGLKRVTGRLIVDTHFFDSYDRAPLWDANRSQRAYDARIGALSVNFNVVTVHVKPGLNVNDPLTAWLDPKPAYMYIQNTTTTKAKGRSSVPVPKRNAALGGGVKFEVKGSMPLKGRERIFYINVLDPARYAGETFRAYLQQVGIKVNGATAYGKVSVGSQLLHRHYSAPLAVILKELNTYSNNFIAEQVVKTIAAEEIGPPGSHAQGQRLMSRFMREGGVRMAGVKLVDGSGLSRKNRFTAQAMTDLLILVSRRFDIGPDVMAALRVMGANGAPHRRFKNAAARAKVRAKTGTLSQRPVVSTLAGYVESQHQQRYAYAFFLNNHRCGARGADRIEDGIISVLYEQGKPQRPRQPYQVEVTQ